MGQTQAEKIVELKDCLEETESLWNKTKIERDELRARVDALVKQLAETLQNKALLEAHLRCRIAGLNYRPPELEPRP